MKNSKGFTLIELSIVVLIIGIIAALAVPRFVRASANARKKESLGVLRQIYLLERAYYMAEGRYQASTETNVIPNISFKSPSEARLYDYTVKAGWTGDIRSSMLAVAKERHDADLDGILHEIIMIDDRGYFIGDFENR